MNPVLDLAHGLIEGLKPGAGNNWTGCCPIHGEVPGKSKPSFSINISTGMWICFSGCGGGHLRGLLKNLNRSRDSIDITMKRLDKFLVAVEKKKSPVLEGGLFKTSYPLPERILGLFERCPVALLKAGFDEELLWQHDIGFDEERGWITYPIRDIDGVLSGIVGKTRGGLDPKYKVYRKELKDMGFPRYELEKSEYLWRWDIVYPQIFFSDQRPVIPVVEGYKACLWMVQNGYENTVALQGTSLSDVQRIFLERLGGTVIWCLDHDAAGQKMVDKNGTRLSGVRQLVMRYPHTDERLQPDDLEPDELHEAVESSLIWARWCASRRRRKRWHER